MRISDWSSDVCSSDLDQSLLVAGTDVLNRRDVIGLAVECDAHSGVNVRAMADRELGRIFGLHGGSGEILAAYQRIDAGKDGHEIHPRLDHLARDGVLCDRPLPEGDLPVYRSAERRVRKEWV